MSESTKPQVAIVDYGMGNLFSVAQACEHAGLRAVITDAAPQLELADAVILPGVGAFGDAMATLRKLDLAGVLRDLAGTSKPLLGICLGMQLLMSRSEEFGSHNGLGMIDGDVVRLHAGDSVDPQTKVPQVGWNRIFRPGSSPDSTDRAIGEAAEPRTSQGKCGQSWNMPLLAGVPQGEYMYFVHSFYARPADKTILASTTRYGALEFCSSYQKDNVFAFQFHPERSGPQGMCVYYNLASMLSSRKGEQC